MRIQRGRTLAVLLAVAAGAAAQTPGVTQYQLTTGVNPPQGGTVSPPGGTFDAGTTVAVSAQPFNGYRFVSWSGPVDSPLTSDARVVMSGPVTLVANFVQVLPPPEFSPTFANLATKPNDNTVPTVTISITAEQPLDFTVASGAPWLTASPASGRTPATVVLRADPSGLAPGNYYNTVAVFSFPALLPDQNQVTVPVQFFVSGTAQLSAAPSALTFTAQAGSTVPQSQTVNVTSTIGSLPVTVTASAGATWLTAKSGPVTPAAVQVQVNPAGLAAGSYTGSLTVSSSQAGAPVTIGVTLTVTPPPIAVTSISNAASGAPALGAPNTILSAAGNFPGCASGARVTVAGAPADVFYSSPTQVNFLTPASAATDGDRLVVVSCAGLTAAPVALKPAAAQPGIFTADGSGTGQAAVINDQGQTNGRAAAGGYVSLFVTGFGAPGPRAADGLWRVTQDVTATVGGAAARVLYAGEAPGATTGLQQINLLLPAGVAKGPAVPLILTFGGSTTQAGVTLNIQ